MSQWNPTPEEAAEQPVAAPVAAPAPAPTAAPAAAPAAAPTYTAPAQPAYAPPPKKDNKKMIIIIASIIGALLLCCIIVTLFGGCAALSGILSDPEGTLGEIVSIDVTPDGGQEITDDAFKYEGQGQPKVVLFGETVWLDGVSFTATERTYEGYQIIDVSIENTSDKDFYLPIQAEGQSRWTAQDANENWLSFSYTEWDIGYPESTGGMVKPGESYSLMFEFKNADTGERADAIFITAEFLKPLEGVGGVVWMTPQFYEIYQANN